MRLIKPSYNILSQEGGIDGIYKAIERAGRLAYKSEDKITDNSAKPFVEKLIKAGHLSVLEHGTVYLQIHWDDTIREEFDHIYCDYASNPYSKIIRKVQKDDLCPTLYVTTNYRILIEQGWLNDLKYLCEPTEHHERRIGVFFNSNIGIMRELFRHRKMSYIQESTRYVGYSIRRPLSEYNCDDISEICQAYSDGFSMREISEKSSFNEWGIRKILLENDIPIRGLNNKGNRVEDYFSVIDTPEKAYLLGLIQTDGNIRQSNRNAELNITQHKDYAWYIEDMLLDFSEYIGKTQDKNCLQLQIGSKRIVHDLISIGIIPNKTKEQTDDDIDKLWESVPDSYKPDFIRGLIDGDGHVSFFIQKRGVNESCNIGFCSTNKHLVDLLVSWFEDNFDYSCKIHKDGTLFKIAITDYKKAIIIGEVLYKNFKYPFGHPKKASAWIKRIQRKYPIADYKDSKFQIIKPSWLDSSSPEAIFRFLRAMDCSEDAYRKLRLYGLKPEQARDILPLVTKSEAIVTGFESDWKYIFKMRTSKATTGKPHPDMIALMDPLLDDFHRLFNTVIE